MGDTPREGKEGTSFEFDEEFFLDALVSVYQHKRDRLLIFGREREFSLFDEFAEDPYLDPFLRSSRFAPLFRRLDQAHRDLWDLLALKGPARARAIRQAPFRDLLVAQLLLEKSVKVQSYDRKRSEEMIELAAFIAEEPSAEQAEEAASVRAAAYCLQADLRRLDQDWAGAEERLWAASNALAGRERSVAHAHLYRQVGMLREDQGELEDAIELLWGAAIEYHAQYDRYSGKKCLLQVAFLYLRRGDPGRAMNLLTCLCAWIGGGRLGAVLDLGRAACLAALNLTKPARRLLRQSLRERRQIRRHEDRIPLEWLECRISLHLGDLVRAVPRLEAIRRWLLVNSPAESACLCSIDLALGYTRQGRLAEQLPELLADLAIKAGEKRWLVKAFRDFGRAILEPGADPQAAARQAARRVFEPPKFWGRGRGRSNRSTGDLSSAAASPGRAARRNLPFDRRGRILSYVIGLEEQDLVGTGARKSRGIQDQVDTGAGVVEEPGRGPEDLLTRLLRLAKDRGLGAAPAVLDRPAETLDEDGAAELGDDLGPSVIGRKPPPPG